MSNKPKIVVTHRVFDETRALLEDNADAILNQTPSTLPREEVLRRAAEADGLIAFMPDRVDEAFLNACPFLRVVACALKGYDNFDVDACTRRGIHVTIVPDLLTVPTAELTIGLMIGLARHIRAGDTAVRTGAFEGWRPTLYGAGLADATVGIVGAGKVGQAVAQRLAGFDATLLYADAERLPPTDEARLRLTHTPFEALMANSDFIVMAVPLLADTYQMIRRETLALCKPTALLINPCRGSVVDENAVADALWADQLAGYAADVFAFEDWALPDRPLEVPETLRALNDRTLFTPHLGSAVVQARMAIEMSAAESALAALRGETPPGAINSF